MKSDDGAYDGMTVGDLSDAEQFGTTGVDEEDDFDFEGDDDFDGEDEEFEQE